MLSKNCDIFYIYTTQIDDHYTNMSIPKLYILCRLNSVQIVLPVHISCLMWFLVDKDFYSSFRSEIKHFLAFNFANCKAHHLTCFQALNKIRDLEDALQFYSFNKYPYTGLARLWAKESNLAGHGRSFRTFFWYSVYGTKVLSQLCKKGHRSRPQRRFERWGVDSKFLCYDRSYHCNRC